MNSSSTEKQAKNKSKKPVAGKAKTGKGTTDKGKPKEPPIGDARFRGDGLKFKCKLVGSADVSGPRGDAMCVEAIKKLKLQALKLHKESKEHKQKITLQVTLKGIRILDEKSQRVEHEHPINKVSFITHDPEDKKIFGYVCSTSSSTGHKLFAIKSEKFIAAVITADLFELFQVVYKLRQQSGLRKSTPNTVRAAPPVAQTAPDQGMTESVYEEVDKNNIAQPSSPKDNEEAQYEELGPAISQVGQSQEQIPPSPKDPTPDGRDRTESSVSSTPSDSLAMSFNSDPFFSPSVLMESQQESVEAEYATVTSGNMLRSGSISSGSSETNSTHLRNPDTQAKSFPLASDATPAFSASGATTVSHNTTSEFPVSFPASPGISTPCESSKQETTQRGLSGQEDLFANFENQGSSGAEAVDDPFAPSGDQTSSMFVSSDGFAAAFDTAKFSDPFDSTVSGESKEVITDDRGGKEAFLTEGAESFEAAFDTTPFTPDPFLSKPSDGGKRTTESEPFHEPEHFDAAFDSSFNSDAFTSEMPKKETDSEGTVEADTSSTPRDVDVGVAFNIAGFATDPFASTVSKDSEPQSSTQNVEDTKAHLQKEPEGFEASFDTSAFSSEPFGPVSSKAAESQDESNTTDEDSFSKSGKFKETFDIASDPFDPVASKTDEAKDTASISEDQTTQGSAKFQTAFDTPAFTVDPFGSTPSKDDKMQNPGETADQMTEESAKFQTTFDTSAFTVDPFGSAASKDDKMQSAEETADETTEESAKFQTTFDTSAFTVDPFGSAASKDDKMQSGEETADETTEESAKFQTTFDTSAFTMDPFGSKPSEDDKMQNTEKNLEEPSRKFEVTFDSTPFDSFSPKDDVPQNKMERHKETKSQLFEASFEAVQFPDAFKSTESNNEKPEAFEAESPWGNAAGQQQAPVPAFDDAFTAESSQSASLSSGDVLSTVTAPSAQVAAAAAADGDDDVFYGSQSVPVSTPALLPSPASSVDTSPSKVVPSADPFGSLKDDLPGLSEPEASTVEGSAKQESESTKGEKQNSKESNLDQDKETSATDTTLDSSNQAHNLKRPNELSVAETKEPTTQRPTSPNRPPPLPPRVLAAPPLPARPRSTSNLSSLSQGDVSSLGLPGSTPSPLRQSYTPKKTPPAPPPRVDLEGKNGFGGNQAKAESFGSGAFKAVFNGTDTSSDSCKSSWAALWPSETNDSENRNSQSNSATNKSADPFSDDFFTNFDTPQQKTKTVLAVSQDHFVDPFSSQVSTTSTTFGEQDFFAAFPAADNQKSGLTDTVADPFSSSSAFTSNDPFDGVSDPFADKGVLGSDPFTGSPAQKSNQVEALKLSDKDPFDGDFSDSFA